MISVGFWSHVIAELFSNSKGILFIGLALGRAGSISGPYTTKARRSGRLSCGRVPADGFPACLGFGFGVETVGRLPAASITSQA